MPPTGNGAGSRPRLAADPSSRSAEHVVGSDSGLLGTGSDPVREAEPDRVGLASHENAWKVLARVNDSVGHAEKKAGVVMTATGAIGGAFYEIMLHRPPSGTVARIPVAVCGLSVVAATAFAMLCLMPRMRSRNAPDSIVYFHHIARRHRGAAGKAEYAQRLKESSIDADHLLDDIGTQIWAITQVARYKYHMAALGLATVLIAVGALAACIIMSVSQPA